MYKISSCRKQKVVFSFCIFVLNSGQAGHCITMGSEVIRVGVGHYSTFPTTSSPVRCCINIFIINGKISIHLSSALLLRLCFL